MLIRHPRQTPQDLAAWERSERADAALARRPALQRAEDAAVECVRRFVERGPCYAGLSCGKDSVVLMGILRALWRRHAVRVPVVHVQVIPHENPDNEAVRAAVMAACGEAVSVDVIDVLCERDASGAWIGKGRLEQGFAEADRRHGPHYITGIRAEESAARRLRAEHFGTTSRNTCAPLSSWRGDDVFAYLHREGLPVHPAYACTLGGSLDRRRIRVATLGGQRGSGHGRTSWEKHYYPDEMIALGFASSAEVPRLLSDE